MVRIRKNLKVSPLLYCSNVAAEDLHPHICQLNQSPWDLLTPSSPHQFEAEELWFNGNESLGYSIAAGESVASPMDIDMAADVVDNNINKGIVRCQKNDGRSWQCKKDAKEGYMFCEHHIRRSSNNCNNNNNNVASNGNGNGNGNVNVNGNVVPSNFVSSNKDSGAAAAKTLSGTRRGRPKAVRKGVSGGNNPYEYYYYSGFGPKWRRKRGKKEGPKIEAATENGNDETSSSTSSENTDPQPSLPHNIETNGNGNHLDYMTGDDFDDEEDESGGGPRRMRRPVKARSLMSIINVAAKE